MPVNFLESSTEATGDSSQQGSNKRRKRADTTTVKTCGMIDGVPIQCAGASLADAPAETTAVSQSVVFENKFIDIFAGVEPNVRKVKKQKACYIDADIFSDF